MKCPLSMITRNFETVERLKCGDVADEVFIWHHNQSTTGFIILLNPFTTNDEWQSTITRKRILYYMPTPITCTMTNRFLCLLAIHSDSVTIAERNSDDCMVEKLHRQRQSFPSSQVRHSRFEFCGTGTEETERQAEVTSVAKQ